jgi:hypothetical protein
MTKAHVPFVIRAFGYSLVIRHYGLVIILPHLHACIRLCGSRRGLASDER